MAAMMVLGLLFYILAGSRFYRDPQKGAPFFLHSWKAKAQTCEISAPLRQNAEILSPISVTTVPASLATKGSEPGTRCVLDAVYRMHKGSTPKRISQFRGHQSSTCFYNACSSSCIHANPHVSVLETPPIPKPVPPTLNQKVPTPRS